MYPVSNELRKDLAGKALASTHPVTITNCARIIQIVEAYEHGSVDVADVILARALAEGLITPLDVYAAVAQDIMLALLAWEER